MKPTERFSSRVENYVKYRPHYPSATIETLAAVCGLTPASIVADIGSGTGFLTELLLENGNEVFAVEPNGEMREAGERLLARFARFHSVAGAAEATTLPDRCADFVTAGQAFHWFDRATARAEFQRILRPGGWVVLLWNVRDSDATPFLLEYERLLDRFGIDYQQVHHRHVDDRALSEFFGSSGFATATIRHRQPADHAALIGRTLSSSYIPEAGDPRYEPMLDELSRLFTRWQAGGRVLFEYQTKIYAGRL